MQAAWYERQGAADEVLVVGELRDPDPDPGPGEVRVRASARRAEN
jgi:NADPH:quinone reductase